MTKKNKVIEDIFVSAREAAHAREKNLRSTDGEFIALGIDALEQFLVDLNRIANSLEAIEKDAHVNNVHSMR